MPAGQYYNNNNNWTPNNWTAAWPWNQPYQPQNNIQNQQPVDNILRVTGPESAKAYPLPKKSQVVLFDSDNPIFYVKATDDGGFPKPLRSFMFEEITPNQTASEPQTEASDLVTKDDLKELENNLSELKAMLEGLVN